ncbi:MAG: T9SS type A sorting domain-containing protein [Bacteroidales bacterium]|nr:T9SS type A sorting domain-containing protein [Bacteroidales bacterium]
MKSIYTITATFLITAFSVLFTEKSIAQNYGLPPGWEFVATSTNPHGMIILLDANPRINDILIQPGDYIGAFFTDDSGNLVCGGADFWLGDENIIFTIYGDEPITPWKDGFSYAEQMYFKVYSWSNQKEYDVDNYSFSNIYYGSDHWTPLGLSAMDNLVCNVGFDAYASATPNPVCIGDEITLSANIFIGTTGSYTYTWTSQPEGFSSTNPQNFLSPLVTTTFYLTVSDGLLISNHELTVTVNEYPVIEAGSDMTICPMGCAELSADAQNFSTIVWVSGGDGSFNNPNTVNAIYYPGDTDIMNGAATLEVIANPLSACNVYASDNVEITIQSIPTFGTETNLTMCGPQYIILDADANNYSTILWSTNGDGTFSNPNSEGTDYFPGTSDIQLGEFTLNICATAIPPLTGQECLQIHVEIIDAPTVFAPASQTKCDNLPIPVTCIPNNYTGLLWTTQGDGTFENPQIPSTKYYAGEQDKTTGGTIVSVNVFGEGACETSPVTKNITLNLNPSPKVEAGDASVVCTGNTLELSGSVEDYTYFMWSTSGDGYFSNMLAINPIYYPGANDETNGGFTLTLTAYPIYPCLGTVSDELAIEIVGEPFVDISIDENQIFPMGQPLELTTQGDDFISINWETTGDGTFEDPNILAPSYMPGTNDASGVEVIFSVVAIAASNCGNNATDQLTVSFTQLASISAGADITACENGATLSAISQFCNSLEWVSNGDGEFTDPSSETTTYIPGPNDVLGGMAELCVNGFYGENQSVSDCIILSIVSNPNIEISNSQVDACHNESVQIEVSATNYSSIFWYTTNGGGEFGSNGNTTNTYNPAPSVDYPQGCITVFVLAQPLTACSIVDEENFDICFIANPEVTANHVDACYNEAVQLEVTATNYSSIFWYTTNGGGEFSSNGTTTNTYNPAPSVDYPQGCITVFVLAQPLGSCTIVDEDSFDICFIEDPEITAGEDATILEDASFSTTSIVTNQASVLWETSGDGYFSDAASVTSEYFPGSQDINTGEVELTITALPIANCGNSVSDQINLTIHRVQNIYIPAGWNGFSSYISNESAIEDVFAPIADYLIIAQTMNTVYWPEGNVNNIGTFSNSTGYKVKLTEGATISLTGKFSTTRTINLIEGWNIIPVLASSNINPYDFVNKFNGALILMKEIGGNGIIWPDLNIFNMPAIHPGNAYLVAVNQNITLTFESYDEMKSGTNGSKVVSNSNSPWTAPEQTTISHSIAFVGSALNQLNTGDFLGAFNQAGKCVGMTEITDGNQNIAVTIFGDEAITSDVEGMKAGEAIGFRIFNNNQQSETTVSVEYSSGYAGTNGLFMENGLSVVENLIIKSTTTNEINTNTISIYPNPSKGMVTFSTDDAFANYHISISNMSGHVIIENNFTGISQLDLSTYPKGFYLVNIKGDTCHSIEKLILD